MSIVIYTAGGARNNPGPAGIGVVIYDGDPVSNPEGAQRPAEVSEYLGKQTNNWAEYAGVIRALTKAQELGLCDKKIEVRLDSKLVAEQLMGSWRVKEPTLKPQYEKARTLIQACKHITFVHVRREYNAEADRLANEAMDRAQ